jgi:hypothetical protein
MEPIGAIVQKKTIERPSRKTERGEFLQEFLQNIKPGWDAARFGELTIGRIARKLQGVPTKDLYYLKRVCEDSKNYAKRFFWELNAEKHNNL